MEPPKEKEMIRELCAMLRQCGWQVRTNWYVVPGRADLGVGDILAKKRDCIMVVECKHLNGVHTMRKLHKVQEQAHRYAAFAKLQHGNAKVLRFWYTNHEFKDMGEMGEEESKHIRDAWERRTGKHVELRF